MRELNLDRTDLELDSAALVREFVPLNRRRVHGDPPLDMAELARWSDLRDLLESALGAEAPEDGTRRRSLRVRAHLKVLVTTHLAQELLHVQDLSESGFFLRTPRPSPPGSPLHIEFHDRDGRSLELEGTVVWTRCSGDPGGVAGMGVAFHALSDWDRTVLLELVESALGAID
jgi:hypothetical protein